MLGGEDHSKGFCAESRSWCPAASSQWEPPSQVHSWCGHPKTTSKWGLHHKKENNTSYKDSVSLWWKGRKISSNLPARGSPAAAALPSFYKAQPAWRLQEMIWPYNIGMRVADVGSPVPYRWLTHGFHFHALVPYWGCLATALSQQIKWETKKEI